MRVALDDAAPLYRNALEALDARASVDLTVQTFLREAAPQASDTTRAIAGELITTALGTLGKSFSEKAHTPAEIDTYADAMADMFCAYLERLG